MAVCDVAVLRLEEAATLANRRSSAHSSSALEAAATTVSFLGFFF